MAAAAPAAMGEGEATRQKRKKKPKPKHVELRVAPSQSPPASTPLPAAPFLQTPTQSAAPGTPILDEATSEASIGRKMRKEQKAAAPPLAPNPTLEEEQQGEEGVVATKKKKHKEGKSSSSPSTAAAAETLILEQEAKVTKKRQRSKDRELSGYSPLPLDPAQTQSQGTKAPHESTPLLAAPFLETPARSPAPRTSMLEEVAMRKRKICKEQKLAALSLDQNATLGEQRENAMAAKMMNESKHMEHILSSPSTSIVVETTIWEQEAKVNKKQRQRKQQEPSGKSPLPLDLAQTNSVQSQGGKSPLEREREADGGKGSSIKKVNEKSPRICVLSKRELIREASKKQRVLPESFVPFSYFVSSCTEQNPHHSSPHSAFFDQFRYDPVREDHKPVLPKTPDRLARLPSRGHSSFESSQPTANETSRAFKSNTTKQQDSGSSSQEKLNVEVKENSQKKTREKKQRKPSGNSLPDPSHTCCVQLQGSKAPSEQDQKARSTAPRTSVLEEVAMSKRKMCKEQKVVGVSLAQNTTSEEQREDAMAANMMKTKESKHMEHTLSCSSASVATETPIWEQEAKVTKKLKRGKDQEPSGYTPLSLDPGQTQPQGTNAPHASKPLPAAPFFEAPAPSPAPRTPMLEDVAAVTKKRKICKEQKVVALSLAQNTTLEEQRENAMAAKMKKESKHMEHTLSSPSTSIAVENTIWEQEAKVNKKQRQRKQQEPSGKSPLPLDLDQTHSVQSQGGKSPLKQEREADGGKGSNIKKINEKRPRIRVLSKRELIKEASKKQRVLPESFVPFSHFVSSCTEENPPHSSPHSAFFDQFRYSEDRKPVLPKTPDRLARLPSRDRSSFESSQPTGNETSRALKSNTTKQQDSGLSSQEKLNVEVKENSQKKKREKKQRKPSGNSLPDPSHTCCVQLQGTKAPPEQDQKADAPKVDNIKKSDGKKALAHAPSKRKLFKETSKEQMLPEGYLAPCDFDPSCTELIPDYSSFHQFCYRPAYQDSNPQPPATADCLSILPPRSRSFELSELSANGTSKANSSVARKSKKKDSRSGSASSSQEKLHAEEMKNPEKKMTTKKQRAPLLTPAEMRSDKYRRVPLDQLVPPPRSPHNLLQENYASDPWKVIVICMLLNLTQGIQVKKIVEGFFEIYPDPHTAVNADPEKMEGYLVTLGLQHIKTIRIQKFSKEYVEKEWTYITELCGVGKYAADAYAIFCAGRATEVVPKDHKLVDYWNYVCFELPLLQGSKSVQEVAVIC